MPILAEKAFQSARIPLYWRKKFDCVRKRTTENPSETIKEETILKTIIEEKRTKEQ